MRTSLFTLALCLFCTVAIAQNNTHNKFGLTWQLPATWVLSPEKNTDTRFYAYPNSGGTGAMDIRALGKNENPAEATVNFMKETSIDPSFIKDTEPKKVKSGKLLMQVFEKDALDMKLSDGTDIYRNQKLILLSTQKGEKYILFLVEVYQKPAKHTKAIENAVKTLKVK